MRTDGNAIAKREAVLVDTQTLAEINGPECTFSAPALPSHDPASHLKLSYVIGAFGLNPWLVPPPPSSLSADHAPPPHLLPPT